MEDLTTPIPRPAGGLPSIPQVAVFVRDAESESVIHQVMSDLGVTDLVVRPGGLSVAMTEMANQASPRLLIVDASGIADPTPQVAELISLCEPSTGVIVIGDSNDIRLYRALTEIGVVDYFFKPLVTALVARSCRGVLFDGHETQGAPGQARPRTGRLILVVGARGGVGATSMAVRIAWRLSESPPRPVALVDLDLHFGDATLQLDASPSHALLEALNRTDRVDDLFLERGMIQVSKRLDLLASLEPLGARIDIPEASYIALLEILQRRYRYVVVDVPLDRVVPLANMLRMPGFLLLVSDSSLASARDVGRLRQMLEPATPDRTIMQILNKSSAPGALPLAEFTRGAGQAPDVIVPYSRDIAAAVNMGVKARPECPPLDHALAPVYARVAGEVVAPERSLLSRWIR